VVEKIVAAFEGIVHQKEDEMVEVVDVPQAKHRFLIGRGGQTRRDLEAQFNISLDIPKAAENGAAPRNTVRIGGQRDAVAKAKAHILELIRNSDDATVQVPRRLHHVIADNGQFFRKLRNDYDVSVDHAGQQPPARPAAWNPRSGVTYDGAAAAANMPLITDDDESAANAHMWHVRDNNAVAADEADGDGNGEIAWVLRGTPENVGHARDVLLKALDAAQKRPATATGYLILHDPRKHRLVIGPQGSQVNAIRRATGCRINVPRDHGQGEAIEIVGERGKVEEAKNIILDVIARGGNAPGRRRAQ
jgi:rRNA processing protein Krr1/Pno1